MAVEEVVVVEEAVVVEEQVDVMVEEAVVAEEQVDVMVGEEAAVAAAVVEEVVAVAAPNNIFARVPWTMLEKPQSNNKSKSVADFYISIYLHEYICRRPFLDPGQS